MAVGEGIEPPCLENPEIGRPASLRCFLTLAGLLQSSVWQKCGRRAGKLQDRFGLPVEALTHQDYVVYPKIVGTGIHLHPLGVILAILCGAELGGLAGIFLAIPLVAAITLASWHYRDHRAAEAQDGTE